MAAPLVIFGFALIILLAVSALFSAAETALTGASRGRMHQLEREGDPAAKRVNKLLDDQETMIGAVLLGYNAINIAASAIATEFITNSFKYAFDASPGTIGVRLEAVADKVHLILWDDGKGLPEHRQAGTGMQLVAIRSPAACRRRLER